MPRKSLQKKKRRREKNHVQKKTTSSFRRSLNVYWPDLKTYVIRCGVSLALANFSSSGLREIVSGLLHYVLRPACLTPPPGGHLYFRLDIILVKELSKHTLITYFLGMNIDPKYVFLHVFSRHLFLPKFMTIVRNTPFFQFCMFLHP